MLAIRLQRVGRQGYATYRLAVQEASRHPSSGRVVAYVGSYNPHTKVANIQAELAQKYLDNGAQPTPRVVKLLADAGVKLPKWVKKADVKTKSIRHAEKLRRNRPAVEAPVEETPVEDTPAEEPAVEEPTEATETPAEDTPAEPEKAE
ncbi:MAG TPA: 30S ribosomal protein S16 [Candidatus Saccharibacteria bacterium]|nr:30S ribosomal protein S16 [Candidatus Saccharibacteria bacterium]HRQ97975.1 30S ribosomal protein S16 [Candidatus Saccharibacteria bacterium]